MELSARSETAQKELNPIWDQWLVLESVRSPSDFPLQFGQLLVSLYDEDFLTGDDEIGSFEVDLAEVWKQEGHCVRRPPLRSRARSPRCCGSLRTAAHARVCSHRSTALGYR